MAGLNMSQSVCKDVLPHESPELLRALDRINLKVNREIRYERVNTWAVSRDSGDCKTYVAVKREDILQQGLLNPNTLFAWVVKVTSGRFEGDTHAILVVAMLKDDGTVDQVVLDSLSDKLKSPEEVLRDGYTPYYSAIFNNSSGSGSSEPTESGWNWNGIFQSSSTTERRRWWP